MKSTFDQLIDRRHTNSLKWNVDSDVIAMWVADMDFKTAPCVQEALRKKVDFGVFGYSDIPDEYYESYQTWWKQRHHFTIEKEWMMFSSGVVPAISSIVRKLTTPGEKVLIQSPVYNIFYNSILNNGRVVVSSDLHYANGEYTIDFDDLEEKLKDPQTTMMILCNPHNPVGKVWSKEELAKIGSLCFQHHVLVISDEIHCDLCEPGVSYTPFASVSDICAQISMTCLSASKAFNLAGVQAACVVVPDAYLRHKVWRGLNTDEVAEPNVFACEAVIAAFQQGTQWLEALRQYIHENRKAASAFLRTNLPEVHVVDAQATYLLWVDCSCFTTHVDAFCTYLEKEKGLLISSGSSYGENGTDFIRINIACPKERMLDGLQRLKEGFEAFKQQIA